MPTPDDYYNFLSADLKSRSDVIRNWYSTHQPTSGSRLEQLVGDLLKECISGRFAISNGPILSSSGEFANEADLVVADQISAQPFFSKSADPVWMIESIYAMIEVKANLNKNNLVYSINKSQRFKSLSRAWSQFANHLLRDSLFIVWSFDAPAIKALTKNLNEAASCIADPHLPDFIIVPGKVLISGGSYFHLARSKSGSPRDYQVYDTSHSLMIFLHWFASWLGHAGARSAELTRYLPGTTSFGSSSIETIPNSV